MAIVEVCHNGVESLEARAENCHVFVRAQAAVTSHCFSESSSLDAAVGLESSTKRASVN